MAGLFGGKKDVRPVDEGLAALRGKSDDEVVTWWRDRLMRTAAIPNETARIGALTPQLRELVRIDDAAERTRLTRGRIAALKQLPDEQRRLIETARERAWSVDRGVLEADQRTVDEIERVTTT